MKRILSILLSIWCMTISLSAQTSLLKGRVLDRGGEPVIGAHVKWNEDKTGVVTDLDGNFAIARGQKSDELVVSFMGYKTVRVKI